MVSGAFLARMAQRSSRGPVSAAEEHFRVCYGLGQKNSEEKALLVRTSRAQVHKGCDTLRLAF
jgi:hypothetical protein